MVNDKDDATWHPLPQRDPFATLADWGREVPPPDDPDPYVSPGRAPWAPKRGLSVGWTLVLIGALVLCLAAVAGLLLIGPSGPVPTGNTPVARVTVTGTCEKKIIGAYGLIASVTATNGTDTSQVGSTWIRWEVTGQEPVVFTKPLTLAPNTVAEHHVNHPVKADQWFRTGECDYGWTPQS